MTEMEITKHHRYHGFYSILLCLCLIYVTTEAFGFDSANSCGPNGKISRRGRAQILAAIPCDFSEKAYCEKAGHAYPWHAVRRFVHENQGLMKRMYGDVLHISVLRDEIQNNDIEDEDIQVTAARYSQEGQRRSSKFMHEPEGYTNTAKQSDVLIEPHFRPLTNATKTADSKDESTVVENLNITTTKTTLKTMRRNVTRYRPYYNPRRRNRTTTTTSTTTSSTTTTTTQAPDIDKVTELSDPVLETAVLEAIKLLHNENDKIVIVKDNEQDDSNLQSNSVYENTLGDNIKIVNSPQLSNGDGVGGDGGSLQNLTQQISTISSTLKPQHFYTRRRPIINSHQQQQHNQQIYKISSNVVKESVLNAKVQAKESERQQQQQEQPSTKTSSSSTSSLSTTTTTIDTTTMLVKGVNNNNTLNTTTTTTMPQIINHSTNEQKTTTTTTTTPSATTNSASSSSIIVPSMLPLRVNGELVSNNNNKRKTTTTTNATPIELTTTTTTNTPTATKPALRDGQLFQDTIKEEAAGPPPVAAPLTAASMTNLRGINACPVKEEVVAPFWANNTRGEILALLNMYPFEQYVHWEKCTHEHKQMYCRDGCRCEQQYRLHRLLAYDPHNECRGIFSDWFRFPSCCICKCYNIPLDFRATSRSPRAEQMVAEDDQRDPIERAEELVKEAIYEYATKDWYRPQDDYADDYDDG